MFEPVGARFGFLLRRIREWVLLRLRIKGGKLAQFALRAAALQEARQRMAGQGHCRVEGDPFLRANSGIMGIGSNRSRESESESGAGWRR